MASPHPNSPAQRNCTVSMCRSEAREFASRSFPQKCNFLPDAVHVVRLNANAAGTAWTGSVDLPRGCGTPDACPVHFALNTNKTALSDLQEWLNPNPRKRPWYRVLTMGGEARPAWWTTLQPAAELLQAVSRFTESRRHTFLPISTWRMANCASQDSLRMYCKESITATGA